MHVLQLGPYPPPEGGITRNMLAIREELRENGHRCSIAATSKSSRETVEKDVFRPRNAPELIRLLARLDYDVLHLHVGGEISGRVMHLIGACAAFGRGKSVLTVHSGGYPESRHGQAAKANSVRGFVFRRFERVIAVNRRLAEVFERYGVEKEKLRVILPFALAVPDPTIEIPEKLKNFAAAHDPVLLSVGGLEAVYDVETQIEAMRQITEKHPKAGLIVAGSGALEKELKAVVAKKSYAASILLAGDVEHAVTLRLIDECDVFLRTTLFDGDAISIREALFLETPVVATDNGMRPEGAHLIPMRDAAALAEKVLGILAEPRKERSVREDDRRNVQEVVKLYGEILETRF